ncbi:MAG: hypothetical protein HN846_04870 [Candidatus Pacebacteria bacterium]|jgi:hypothetical protein|nr:hypothetical protein [Candidatus Paceibacterota bacterium]MBT4004749.1 hypothetical protein [Candidatus Paceibacterota bacterium]MBT6899260.1 hypothetical protein [Candidatus Paceibacterota bacterium]MBT7184160.1 hypothetical protein [Candidatus Paceibacterota bacterium]MBT7310008.1 hypothetical protein [Candidatus Paceibacterota bacterium]
MTFKSGISKKNKFAILTRNKKPKNWLYIYIYSSPQKDHVNLVQELSTFSSNTRVIHFSRFDLELENHLSWKILLKKRYFFKSLNNIHELINIKYCNWKFIDIIPMQRFKLSKLINSKLKIIIFKILAIFFKTRIVVIYNFPTQSIQKFVTKLKPFATIADCTEYWTKSNCILSKKMATVTISNNYQAEKNLQKYSKTSRVSAGYFTDKTIDSLYRKTAAMRAMPRTIAYLGSIDWRLDYDSIKYAMRTLSDFSFIFFSDELFSYDYEHQSLDLRKKNAKAKREFEKIKTFSNFSYIPTKNHKDVISNLFTCSAGIIPYKINTKFYQNTHPVKQYFYLSAGIPIVASKFKMITNSEPFIRTYENKEEFVKQILQSSKRVLTPIERKEIFLKCKKQTIKIKALHIQSILYEI